MNRLSARVASGLADTAANVSLLAQDAPERLRQELQLFWQEVEQEAARLEREGPAAEASSSPFAAASPFAAGSPGGAGSRGASTGWATGAGTTGPNSSAAGAAGASSAAADPQEMIDALRAQVAGLAQRLDAPPSASGTAGSSPPASAAPGRGA